MHCLHFGVSHGEVKSWSYNIIISRDHINHLDIINLAFHLKFSTGQMFSAK